MSERDLIEEEIETLQTSLSELRERSSAARTDLASLRRYELERSKAWRTVKLRAAVIAVLTLGAGYAAYRTVGEHLAEVEWREQETTITWAGTTRASPQRNCQLQAVVSGDGGARFIARRLSVRCDGGEEVRDTTPRCEHLAMQDELELGCFMNAPIVVDTRSRMTGFLNHGQWHWLDIEPDSGASANSHIVRGPAVGYAVPSEFSRSPSDSKRAIYDPSAEREHH